MASERGVCSGRGGVWRPEYSRPSVHPGEKKCNSSVYIKDSFAKRANEETVV